MSERLKPRVQELLLGASAGLLYCRTSMLLLMIVIIVIVEGFPEADPDVEQAQAAAQAAEEAGGDQGTEPGIRKQKIVVSPFRGPGKDDEKNSGNSADQDEQKNRGAVQPELQLARWRRAGEGRGFPHGARVGWRARGFNAHFRICGHRAPRR